jgi:TatD DNase family protein
MPYFDAHCHLQDSRLTPGLAGILEDLRNAGVSESIVNGTHPADWPGVATLAQQPGIRPAFGLHPWRVGRQGEDWLQQLEHFLVAHPQASVGEIGLDRWMRNPDLPHQRNVFISQLELAIRLQRPVTIHCLQAWGTMLEIMEDYAARLPGFLLHSFAGPVGQVDRWVELGACFSLSGYFARPEKAAKLEAWRRIPLQRILIETDAPDMLPPPESRIHPLKSSDGAELNHPINLLSIYDWAASWLGLQPAALSRTVAENFHKLFTVPSGH